MPRGVKKIKTVEEENSELQAKLTTIQKRMEVDTEAVREIENRLKEIEINEQTEFITLAKQLAEKKGTSLIDLLKPLE